VLALTRVLKPENGKKAEHTCVVGLVANFPREKDAWQEIEQRHLKPCANAFSDPRCHVLSDLLRFLWDGSPRNSRCTVTHRSGSGYLMVWFLGSTFGVISAEEEAVHGD
jgi:hypothetical protein